MVARKFVLNKKQSDWPITLRSRGSNPAPAIPAIFLKMNSEIFIILVLAHFVSDYFFQPTYWGIKKLKYQINKWNLFHSLQYTLIFLPVLYFLNISLYWAIYLFAAHFITDTYLPVNLWNKYIRNAINKNKIPKNEPPNSVEAVEDQIIHLLILLPLA